MFVISKIRQVITMFGDLLSNVILASYAKKVVKFGLEALFSEFLNAIKEKIKTTLLEVKNTPYFIPIGVSFGRRFAVICVLTDKTTFKVEGHEKAIWLGYVNTGIHVVPFCHFYVTSFPKKSERWEKLEKEGRILTKIKIKL